MSESGMTKVVDDAPGPPPQVIALLHSPRCPSGLRERYSAAIERLAQAALARDSKGEPFVKLASGKLVPRLEYLKLCVPTVALAAGRWWTDDDVRDCERVVAETSAEFKRRYRETKL